MIFKLMQFINNNSTCRVFLYDVGYGLGFTGSVAPHKKWYLYLDSNY